MHGDQEPFLVLLSWLFSKSHHRKQEKKRFCLRNNLCGQVELNSPLVQTRKIQVNGTAFFFAGRNMCQLNWQKLKQPITANNRKNTTVRVKSCSFKSIKRKFSFTLGLFIFCFKTKCKKLAWFPLKIHIFLQSLSDNVFHCSQTHQIPLTHCPPLKSLDPLVLIFIALIPFIRKVRKAFCSKT